MYHLANQSHAVALCLWRGATANKPGLTKITLVSVSLAFVFSALVSFFYHTKTLVEYQLRSSAWVDLDLLSDVRKKNGHTDRALRGYCFSLRNKKSLSRMVCVMTLDSLR